MAFTRKYPETYHRDVALLELRHRDHNMTEAEKTAIRTKFGHKHQPKRKVTEREVFLDPDLFLVDYSALSCVPLSKKKNRYLWNKDGYHVYGFLGAKCVQTNERFSMFVSGTQIKQNDLKAFKHLIERHLGRKIKLATDNRHDLSLLADKKESMLIEVEFGGIKTIMYKKLRSRQSLRKYTYPSGKTGRRVFTNLSFSGLVLYYMRRFNEVGIITLRPERINDLAKERILDRA